jgi:hypothetical protein
MIWLPVRLLLIWLASAPSINLDFSISYPENLCIVPPGYSSTPEYSIYKNIYKYIYIKLIAIIMLASFVLPTSASPVGRQCRWHARMKRPFCRRAAAQAVHGNHQ